MPSRSVPFGVKPRTWSATSSPRKPSMGSPASNPYAPTPRACWIPAANTGVLKTVSTTFATSPLMKIARASAVAQAPRSWPPFAISPYRFSASPELATSPQHFAAVLVRAIPSSFASSGCDFDVAVQPGSADQLNDGQRSSKHSNPEEESDGGAENGSNRGDEPESPPGR